MVPAPHHRRYAAVHGGLPALVLALSLPGSASAQGPLVTEFQASNSATLLDEDGDSSDWIELHNPGPGAQDLSGWYLTDDDNSLDRWALPSGTTLAAGTFLVLFASGKDRAGPELHTNFKLAAAGEYLALVRPDGSTIEQQFDRQYPTQFSDTSYGLAFDPRPTTQETYFLVPSPGAPNGPGSPLILDPGHSPEAPAPGEDLVVFASVPEDLHGGGVTLVWRVDYTGEQFTAMLDDGQGADATAGDRVFSAFIPAGAHAAGQMVRWKVTALDASDLTSATLPLFQDPEGSAEYLGTMALDPAVQSALPIWYWWVENTGKAGTVTGTRASLWYDGEFYDNVHVRARGGSSLWYPKKSFKFDFNKDQRLRFDDGPRNDEIDLNTTWADKSFVRQPLAYNLYLLGGCASSSSFPVRVEQNGDFHSVAIFIEDPGEEAFLERHDRDPNGALYKMYNVLNTWKGSTVEKKTRLHEGHKDLKNLVQGLQQSGSSLETYLFDSVDIAMCINYLAITSLIHDNDHIAKNYYLYRDTEEDGEWEFIPWDKDLTWGRNYTIGGGVLNDSIWAMYDPYSHPLFGDSAHPKNDGPFNILIDRLYSVPRIQEMYLRRLRSLMDEFLQPNSEDNRFLENWIHSYHTSMAADVALDQAKWGIPNWGQPYDFSADLERLIKKYLRKRRHHLYEHHGSAGSGLVPAPNPSPFVMIRHIEGDPISGKGGEEYVQLYNSSDMAADLSAWSLGGAVAFDFPMGTVVPAHGLIYVAAHARQFRKRATSPTGGEGHHVAGSFEYHIEAGEWVRLYDPGGALVHERQY